ncbi:MAG: hypothetical protein H6Q42_809, partial [Deltaproteobacteria bacterium]|nr:hypothetical protein [Deltaproteobacteria bacterium]
DSMNQDYEKKGYIKSDYSSSNDQHKSTSFSRNLIR